VPVCTDHGGVLQRDQLLQPAAGQFGDPFAVAAASQSLGQ
jgi:hypothetical protein